MIADFELTLNTAKRRRINGKRPTEHTPVSRGRHKVGDP